jgi:activator of HSP90 ATPase
MESFVIIEVIKVKPAKIYKAWLDSKLHSEFTGAKAEIAPLVNGKFTAWDDYISGTTVELIPDRKIIQKWRTTEFPDNSPDSILEIDLEEVENGTKLTLRHTNIPKGQSDDYKQGWIDFYIEPMKRYFKI